MHLLIEFKKGNNSIGLQTFIFHINYYDLIYKLKVYLMKSW
jgi:hypothetical protein